MSKIKKFLVFLVTALAISSLTIADVIAQMPKPSVPEFTVEWVDKSYDVPATTSIDPYTGKTMTNPAYHVENKSIELTIKNQEWTEAYGINYNIRVKGHFEDNWTKVFPQTVNSPSMTNSDYTLLVFSSSDGVTYKGFYRGWGEIYAPKEGKIDFQVQAFVRGYVPSDSIFGGMVETTLTQSDWSNTQTIIIDPTSSATQQPTTPAPTQPPTSNPTPYTTPVSHNPAAIQVDFGFVETGIAIVLGIVVALLAIAVVAMRKRIQVLDRKLSSS